jgi:hypothetical protein
MNLVLDPSDIDGVDELADKYKEQGNNLHLGISAQNIVS